VIGANFGEQEGKVGSPGKRGRLVALAHGMSKTERFFTKEEEIQNKGRKLQADNREPRSSPAEHDRG